MTKLAHNDYNSVNINERGFIMLEAAMLVCFGVSWPVSLYKSIVSKSTKGKSVVFLYLIVAGYICGVLNKIVNGYDHVLWLYVINGLLVSADIVCYYRNRKLEKALEAAGS